MLSQSVSIVQSSARKYSEWNVQPHRVVMVHHVGFSGFANVSLYVAADIWSLADRG